MKYFVIESNYLEMNYLEVFSLKKLLKYLAKSQEFQKQAGKIDHIEEESRV